MLKLALIFVSVLFPLLFHSSLGNNIINTNTSSSTICGTKSCPNGPNISYPFWISHGSPPQEYCGYPEFGLICLDNGYTIFSPPPGLYYYVKDIDYDNHSLKLIDFDTTNSTCPRALHGFPLGNLPLSHSSLNLNLSFYYNCSFDSHPSDVPDITCLREGSKESFVFLMGNEREGFDWSESCEENVDVTVMKDQISNNGEYGLVREFGRAMNEGFVLQWETEDTCKECEASEGYCGYSSTKKEVLCFCKDGTVRTNNCGVAGENKSRLSKLIIGLIAGGIGVLPITCIILYIFRHKLSPIMPEILKIRNNDQDIEAFIKNNHGPLAIKRYTYSDIKKMTNSFESKLGEGGYGQVYKGILNNGGLVAVKLLKASKGNGEEFINEVMSISKTSHVNIVALLGFCLEGNKKKALIYEFMPNGSLEKYIHNNDSETNPPLSWERLHHIAKGIARGLEYLHRGCNTRILHFDIKPNNILLDKNFSPKISDFGLAKLCSKTHSIVTMLDARGTIGYIAPEVWNRHFGGVSHKSDVYSYGMMILEMVGAKHNNTNGEVGSDSSELYFPHWIYKHIEGENSSMASWQGASISNEENEIVRKMIIVGLWCIQTIPSERPPMSRVIEMLEGSIDLLQSPPKPFSYSTTQTKVESCTTTSTTDDHSFSPAD